jgi:lipopolysaccharide/colanic/teichoic acid biosynthesis glycosyltransferase
MVQNAEEKQKELEHYNEVDGPVFKIKNDPRITKLGKMLRKLSIDELPQLINVLKGEMSLVGPRPPLPKEVEKYDLNYLRRFSVKPGITCLWQVNGRCKVSFDKWMKLDMEYIDNWSLWLDIKILLKTIPAVLKGSGAE